MFYGLLDQPSACYVCLQEDTVGHILLQCVHTRQVWYMISQVLGISAKHHVGALVEHAKCQF